MKLIICGIGGKMGQLLVSCAYADGHTVVGGIEPAGSTLAGGTMSAPDGSAIPVRTSLAALAKSGADAVIDFSAVSAAAANAAACAKLKLPLVVGTTGLGTKEQGALTRAAKAIPVIFASNMSTGVNVLLSIT
ncbi:MAG TPA: 4-hydroxy-tetrahydrodipicolinate reductase, partial [bacterium]|nr:4-hydroxy-tetrahydrodipicolinate reductase [bacterium]